MELPAEKNAKPGSFSFSVEGAALQAPGTGLLTSGVSLLTAFVLLSMASIVFCTLDGVTGESGSLDNTTVR